MLHTTLLYNNGTCSDVTFRCTLHHNELRGLIASLLMEVYCSGMANEPRLQQLLLRACANRDNGAHMDIVCWWFWRDKKGESILWYSHFSPHAPSNRHSSLPSTYRTHKGKKKRESLQYIRDIEHRSFSPFVFSSSGGMAREATVF